MSAAGSDSSHPRVQAVARVVAAAHRWHAARVPELLGRARALLEDGEPPRLRDVLGIAHREVPLNKTLGWLLDPRAPHGANGRVLAAFARWLGADALAEDALAGAVEQSWCERRPFGWPDGRKPDLVFRGRSGALLIENKVFADEGPEQFDDYARAFSTWAPAHKQVLVVMARDARVVPAPYSFRLHTELGEWAALTAGAEGLPRWTRVVLTMLATDLAGADTAPTPDRELRSLVARAEGRGLEPVDATRLAVLLDGRMSALRWSP